MALRRARCGKPAEGGSKNQLTLPKAVVDRFPGVGSFAVREEEGRIVLSPVVPAAVEAGRGIAQRVGVRMTEFRAWPV